MLTCEIICILYIPLIHGGENEKELEVDKTYSKESQLFILG